MIRWCFDLILYGMINCPNSAGAGQHEADAMILLLLSLFMTLRKPGTLECARVYAKYSLSRSLSLLMRIDLLKLLWAREVVRSNNNPEYQYSPHWMPIDSYWADILMEMHYN